MSDTLDTSSNMPVLSSHQILFLFHVGFILVLPLAGTTVTNTTMQLIQYFQYGYYTYNCVTAYVSDYFDKESFEVCRSHDIVSLAISYPVAIGIFNFLAYKSYKFITSNIKLLLHRGDRK